MSLKELKLKNFKSYYQESVENLNKGVNVFLGKNGHGKSNLFASITFLFTDKFHYASDREIIFHNSNVQQNKTDPISVEVEFDKPTNQNIPVLIGQGMSIKRVWTYEKEKGDTFYINDQATTQSKLENALNLQGISRQNPYNIVQQGNVRQITKLDDQGIYSLLEEVTGVKQFQKKEKETRRILQDIDQENEDIKEILKEIQEKIQDLESKKGDYENFQEKETESKCLKYLLAEKQVEELQDKINKMEKLANDKKNEILNLIPDSSQNQDQKQQIINYTSQLRQEMQNLRQIEQNLSKQKLELQQLQNQEKIGLTQSQNQKNKMDEEELSTQQQNKQDNDNLSNLEKEFSKIEQEKESLINEVENLRDQYQLKEQELVPLLTQQQMSNKSQFKNIQERNQHLENNIKNLQESILKKEEEEKLQKQKIQEYETTINQQKQELEQKKKLVEDKIQISKNFQKDIEIKQKELEQHRIKSVQLNQQYNQNIINKDHLYIQCQDLQQKIEQQAKDPIIQNIEKIQKKIEERKINGVLGLLVDFLDLNDPKMQKFFGQLDIAIKQKFFAFLVENEQTASEIIKINNELKLGRIQIYTISWAQEKMKLPFNINYPQQTDIQVLMQIVKIKQNIKFSPEIYYIFQFLTQNFLVVKDYKHALTYAKQYNLTCITANLDIVYASGFLTKVGDSFQKYNKLQIYNQFQKLKKQYQELDLNLRNYKNSQKPQQENQEMKIKRNLAQLMQKYKISASQDQEEQQEILKISQNLQIQQNTLNEMISLQQKYEQFIKKYKQQIAIFEGQKKQKFEGHHLQPQQEKQIKQLQQKLKELTIEIERKLKQQQQIEKQYSDLQNQLNQFKNEHIKDIKNYQNLEKRIIDQEIEQQEKQKEECEKNVKNLRLKIQNLQKELSQKNQSEISKQFESKEKLDQQQEQIQILSLKIQELNESKKQYENLKILFGEVKAFHQKVIEKYENLTKKQVIGKLQANSEKDKHKFTIKDKETFQALEQLREQYKHFSEKFNQLQDDQQKLVEILDVNEQESKQAVNNIFGKFKDNFEKIFLKIVPSGQVEIKKVHTKQQQETQQTQNSLNSSQNSISSTGKKQLHGINIKLSFNKEFSTKQNWHELSDGQKSVVAIALIFALQKIDPAPFYVFDEIDAALDTNYRQKIIQIIQENSKKAQYLISTFKSEWTDLKEASFYHIFSENNVSQVEQIQQNEAQKIMQQNEDEELQINDNQQNQQLRENKQQINQNQDESSLF
ncbi:SMCs flexible hinge [Pseudocohnilembus persalinus]|uniref:SMCs flexible hinge n=1 Tax=Pseudocohnilembus persalinus TaxID=266149 RepID=A0A0V0QGQ9_PSEPJ|nr:SMCs flexible hinge [Pseudocohnilembus persalinus]|eukprot:KRX01371.1 SMCs flexible hinge [Pseudocohnilembus persalinus]